MVWYMVWYDMIWCGVVWYGMVSYGMIWYGVVWYGMVWYGMICIGYHMRDEVISVLSLEGRYHILSRVSSATEGQNMIS